MVREAWSSSDAFNNISTVQAFLNSSAVGQPLDFKGLPVPLGEYLASPGTLRPGAFLTAADGSAFLVMQSDGNLCLYRGTRPSDNLGKLWCSGSQGSASEAH